MKRLTLVALVAVFAAESLVFLDATHRRFAWSYPRWFDQAQYLEEAYGSYEAARRDGFLAGERHALETVSPQGALHGFLALPLLEVAGPSRTAVLALNLLAFIGLQAATFLAVRRVSGRAALAWAAVALLAALRLPWCAETASAVDFRLDWLAMCAYGTALAVAVAGDGFRSTRWAALLGGVVGAAILIRFLTAVYFGLIFGVVALGLLAGRKRGSRLGRLLLAGVVAALIIAPVFWRNRGVIYTYYWVGHIAGPERVLRDTHLRLLASWRWLLEQLVFTQLGTAAVLLGLGVGAAFLSLRAARRPAGGPIVSPERGTGEAWVLAFVFLLVPMAVLAVQPEKSSAPASIMIPGAAWILFLAWTRAARPLSRRAANAVAAAAVVAGALVFVRAETRRTDFDERAPDMRAVNALGDFVYFRSEEAGIVQPRIAVNWVVDGMDAASFQVLGYERHCRMIRFVRTLPAGLFETTPEAALGALADSDFVLLVTRAAAVWPFDRQMKFLLPQMRAWCDAHLVPDGHLDTADFSLLVYERRSLGALRPASALDLDSLERAEALRPGYASAEVPSAPVFPQVPIAIGTTQAEFRYVLGAAFSPIRYQADGLPKGLAINPDTGEIRGRVGLPGTYTAQVTATNPKGSTSTGLRIQVGDKGTFAFAEAPQTCRVGVPTELDFGVFDEGGHLDFIDVTDLTAAKTLDRLVVSDATRRSWVGRYALALATPGAHTMLMRFVCYDASRKDPYYYTDRTFIVSAAP